MFRLNHPSLSDNQKQDNSFSRFVPCFRLWADNSKQMADGFNLKLGESGIPLTNVNLVGVLLIKELEYEINFINSVTLNSKDTLFRTVVDNVKLGSYWLFDDNQIHVFLPIERQELINTNVSILSIYEDKPIHIGNTTATKVLNQGLNIDFQQNENYLTLISDYLSLDTIVEIELEIITDINESNSYYVYELDVDAFDIELVEWMGKNFIPYGQTVPLNLGQAYEFDNGYDATFIWNAFTKKLFLITTSYYSNYHIQQQQAYISRLGDI